VIYEKEITAKDVDHLFSSTRIIRTEMSTLIGLLIKGEIDFSVPSSAILADQVKRTENLLEALHHSMSRPFFQHLQPDEYGKDPFDTGEALREPIFYSGESAYSFQYRDLAVPKYVQDETWLLKNVGFSIEAARDVANAIGKVQDKKFETILGGDAEQKNILSCFTFTIDELTAYTNVDQTTFENVLNVFTLLPGDTNREFRTIHDFNIATARPLLRYADGSFLLFQRYGLFGALYESPFYWMCSDKEYFAAAMEHRGRFTEQFSCERLQLVFGAENVHSNVSIVASREKRVVGEIDVLVLFGNRAIVLQAKSKRLTLEARKGNDGQIKSDFQKSIQDSYDQGLACAKLLQDNRSYSWKDGNGVTIKIPPNLREIYIFCIVSDHYPALSFQSRQFLRFEASETIPPPFVLDVFTLDVMTEMLRSPLHFLSYVNRR
jgi:hypothetical protein